MGSGLILLVIVGAWLAVLVPLGLRSSGGSDALLPAGPRDAGDPGRVLARRSRPSGRPDPEPEPALVPAVVRAPAVAPDVRREAAPGAAPVVQVRGSRRPAWRRRSRSDAERRRRRLLVLLLLGVAAGVAAGLAGPEVLLPVLGGTGVLVLLLLVHLRRQAVKRAAVRRAERRALEDARRAAVRAEREREQERLEAEEQARERARALRRRQVAGIPSRMPPRPAARRREPEREQDLVVLRQAPGGEWLPVPVPLPMYVRHSPERYEPVRAPRPVPAPAAAEPAPYEHQRVPGGW